MSTRGEGYGSEDHLRNQLVATDRRLDNDILEKIRRSCGTHAELVHWHSNYTSDKPELRGMDFLPAPDRELWKRYWPDRQAGRDPNRTGIHNWDAVGWIETDHVSYEWILVEAKAHLQELSGSPACGAGEGSQTKIRRAFQKTRFNMGLTKELDTPVPDSWFAKGTYQTANRLAALNFLLRERQPPILAHLVFLYFTGEKPWFGGQMCPRSDVDWVNRLARTSKALEVPQEHAFSSRVHKLFFDVSAANIAR